MRFVLTSLQFEDFLSPSLVLSLFLGAAGTLPLPTGAAAQAVVSTPSFYNCDGADAIYGTADDDCRPDKNAGSPLIDAVTAAGPSDAYDIDGDGDTGEVTPGPFIHASRNNGSSADQGYAESSGSALPVELTSLRARASGGTVVLRWATASEQNNTGFHVQRRVAPTAGADGAAPDWNKRTFVEGRGTTTEPQDYRWTDEAPFEADRLQYRLVQVDADGTKTPSDPVTVERPAPSKLTLHPPAPNPVQSRAQLRYALPKSVAGTDVQLLVFDELGRQVASRTAASTVGRHTLSLDASRWAGGTYFVRLRAAAESETVRLTVIR